MAESASVDSFVVSVYFQQVQKLYGKVPSIVYLKSYFCCICYGIFLYLVFVHCTRVVRNFTLLFMQTMIFERDFQSECDPWEPNCNTLYLQKYENVLLFITLIKNLF